MSVTQLVHYWRGCRQLQAPENVFPYVSNETPMLDYINAHAVLEQRRQRASRKEIAPPRVMIVGPPDSGKSTLLRILLNYATRVNRAPLMVDLDTGLNQISVAGSIAALQVHRPLALQVGRRCSIVAFSKAFWFTDEFRPAGGLREREAACLLFWTREPRGEGLEPIAALRN